MTIGTEEKGRRWTEQMNSQEKIALMHERFGSNEERKCKECDYYEHFRYRNKWYRKCRVYGMSHSEATDWNAGFVSCGCIDTPTNCRNIYKTKRPQRIVEQLNGQMEIQI